MKVSLTLADKRVKKVSTFRPFLSFDLFVWGTEYGEDN